MCQQLQCPWENREGVQERDCIYLRLCKTVRSIEEL